MTGLQHLLQNAKILVIEIVHNSCYYFVNVTVVGGSVLPLFFCQTWEVCEVLHEPAGRSFCRGPDVQAVCPVWI